MSATLGKRKRPSGTVRAAQSEDIKNGSDDLDDQRRVQEIFKKHFEARYKPLPVEKINEPDLDEQSDVPSSDDEAWSGFSSEEEPPVVEVDHANSIDVKPGSSKDEWKAFMSSKPPAELLSNTERKVKPVEDDKDEVDNIKNDIALQRLLSESHLMSGDISNGFDPSGKARIKALDLRFQALGSKDSLFKQEKMPMNMRKGIASKRRENDGKRRSEAKEAGIILERQTLKRKTLGKRERGVGAPAVGKFRGGMLTLSKRDIVDIQGKKRGPQKKGKKR